jgi:hypothetical protein
MKRTIALTAVTLSLMSSQAVADEHRGGDVALGALAGAVVLGPIGAIAGAAVGYAAGPSIAHSWGIRHSDSTARRSRGSPAPASKQTSNSRPVAPARTPQVSAASHKTASSAPPPVQTLE